MICGPELSNLTSVIHPNITNRQPLTDQYFLEHTILSLRNVEADEINSLMCDPFPGQSRIYSSADSIEDAENGA